MKSRRSVIAAALLGACWAAPAARAQESKLPDLAWSRQDNLEDVRGVFCHPTLPQVAWIATGEGLLRSQDEGRSWQAVPAASGERLGLVTALTACDADEDVLLLGTDGKGVYLSTDGGASLKRLGTGESRPASAHVAAVGFVEADPSWRTILVSHGTAAGGMSLSRDLGESWAVLGSDRYLRDFVAAGQTIMAAGAMTTTEGRVWGIHYSGTDGYRWDESCSGIRPTEPVRTRGEWHYYMGTLDGDILETPDGGHTWRTMARFPSATWVSLLRTFGRTASTRVLAGYDPRGQGLALSAIRFDPASVVTRNKGLYVGPFVRSGATCRASANGTVYYIVMNGRLWIGRREPPPAGPAVLATWCSPSTVWVGHGRLLRAEGDLHHYIEAVASGEVADANVRALAAAGKNLQKYTGAMGFKVLARVRHADGPSAIATVTADTIHLGAARAVELHDDGRHGDGAAGDGLYAGDVSFTAALFDPQQEGRRGDRPFPGLGAITVTAADKAGRSDEWSAVVSIQPQAARVQPVGKEWRARTGDEGTVSISPRRGKTDTELNWQVNRSGPWRIDWGTHGHQRGPSDDINGLGSLSFSIRGDVSQDVSVQLIEQFRRGGEVLDEHHYSQPVALIAGGHLKAITPTYQQVRVPIGRLLPPGTYFLRRHFCGIALSAGPDSRPGQYSIDNLALEP